MDWERLTSQLEEVERHIAIGESLIARARDSFSRAIELGLDPAEGKHVLQALEAVQEVYLQQRDELLEVRRRMTN
jgi:hypothetical protein